MWEESLQAEEERHELDSSELEASRNYDLTTPRHLERDRFVFVPPQATMAFKSGDLQVQDRSPAPLSSYCASPLPGPARAPPSWVYAVCRTDPAQLHSGGTSYVVPSTLSPVWFHLVRNVSSSSSFNLFCWVFFPFKTTLGLFLDPSH